MLRMLNAKARSSLFPALCARHSLNTWQSLPAGLDGGSYLAKNTITEEFGSILRFQFPASHHGVK